MEYINRPLRLPFRPKVVGQYPVMTRHPVVKSNRNLRRDVPFTFGDTVQQGLLAGGSDLDRTLRRLLQLFSQLQHALKLYGQLMHDMATRWKATHDAITLDQELAVLELRLRECSQRMHDEARDIRLARERARRLPVAPDADLPRGEIPPKVRQVLRPEPAEERRRREPGLVGRRVDGLLALVERLVAVPDARAPVAGDEELDIALCARADGVELHVVREGAERADHDVDPGKGGRCVGRRGCERDDACAAGCKLEILGGLFGFLLQLACTSAMGVMRTGSGQLPGA
jgi:hypothetical protein